MAGHVLLKYPSGGLLLTSCGHWMEMIKMDVSENRVLRLMEEALGSETTNKIIEELKQCKSAEGKIERIQSISKSLIRSAVPCRSIKSKIDIGKSNNRSCGNNNNDNYNNDNQNNQNNNQNN